MSLFGARGEEKEKKPLTPPVEMYDCLPENVIVRTVAGIYVMVTKDIRNNKRVALSFEDALKLHELLDAIEQSFLRVTE